MSTESHMVSYTGVLTARILIKRYTARFMLSLPLREGVKNLLFIRWDLVGKDGYDESAGPILAFFLFRRKFNSVVYYWNIWSNLEENEIKI